MENKVLRKNLERIEQYNKNLANQILMFQCEKSNISIIKTKFDEYNLVYNSVLIHNNDGAQLEAVEVARKVEPDKNALRIVYGLGLGYLPDEMAHDAIETNSNIIIYEPKLEILKFVLSIAQIDALYDDNVYLCSNKDDLMEYVRKLTTPDTKMTISFLTSYKNLFYDDIKDVLNCAQRAQGLSRAVENTYLSHAPKSLANQFLNLKSIIKTPLVDELKDIYKGKTALVLSAGPSLKENIELIKNNQDKFVIIAVNVALKLLAQHDITPDFIVAIEAYTRTQQFDLTDISKSYLVTETFVNPEVYGFKTKNTFNYISKGNFLNPWIRKLLGVSSDINTYGTVSYSALELAYLMGFKKIIVCGQDLAYKDGKCYAKGSQYEDLECVFDEENKKYVIQPLDLEKYANALSDSTLSPERKIEIAKKHLKYLNSNIYTVKGQDGSYIPTQTGYALFVDFFREYVLSKKQSNSSVEFINSSVGGAQIDGFKNIALTDVIKDLEPIEKIDLTSIKANYDKNDVNSKIESLKSKITSSLADFSQMREVISKLLKEVEIKKVLTSNCEKLLKKLKECFMKLGSIQQDPEMNLIYRALLIKVSNATKEDFLSDIETLTKTLKMINSLLNNEIALTKNTYLNHLAGYEPVISK